LILFYFYQKIFICIQLFKTIFLKQKTMKNNQESKDNKIGSTSFDPKKRCLLDAHWRLRVEGDLQYLC
jgi:hypothetical protein